MIGNARQRGNHRLLLRQLSNRAPAADSSRCAAGCPRPSGPSLFAVPRAKARHMSAGNSCQPIELMYSIVPVKPDPLEKHQQHLDHFRIDRRRDPRAPALPRQSGRTAGSVLSADARAGTSAPVIELRLPGSVCIPCSMYARHHRRRRLRPQTDRSTRRDPQTCTSLSTPHQCPAPMERANNSVGSKIGTRISPNPNVLEHFARSCLHAIPQRRSAGSKSRTPLIA